MYRRITEMKQLCLRHSLSFPLFSKWQVLTALPRALATAHIFPQSCSLGRSKAPPALPCHELCVQPAEQRLTSAHSYQQRRTPWQHRSLTCTNEGSAIYHSVLLLQGKGEVLQYFTTNTGSFPYAWKKLHLCILWLYHTRDSRHTVCRDTIYNRNSPTVLKINQYNQQHKTITSIFYPASS